MKRFVKVSLLLTLAVFVFSSCNCYKRMIKNVDKVQVACNPEVVTLKGKNAVTEVTVTFPAKYFDESSVWKITPVLVYEGGEVAGTPKFVQGEEVQDNYTVISWKQGGSYTQKVSIPYTPAAEISTLELRVEAKCVNSCSKKASEFSRVAAIAVAQGVRNNAKLANYSSYMGFCKDNFKKVVTVSNEAEILYQINRSKVRPAELTKEQIKMFEDFVKENSNKDRTTLGNIYAKGYASPDGPLKFNDKLSKARSESGKAAISEQLKDVNASYDVASYGEDWEGFKELVKASDMKDKDLILQVLEMYSSPVERDNQIQNMTAVFKELKENVFPALRRTKLVASADIAGKTDKELLAAAKNNINSLTLEEALYTATLEKNNKNKIALYNYAAEKFNDARAYNNLGACYAKQGAWSKAEKALKKAASIDNNSNIANNLAAVAIEKGDWATAEQYLSALNSPYANSNKSLLALSKGENATANLKGLNLAVAELNNNNLAAAKKAIASEKSGRGEYVKAVIAMREGNTQGALSSLKSAIAKVPSLKAVAAKDVEFAKLHGTAEFLAL